MCQERGGAGAAETNKRVEQAHSAVVAATAAVSRADRAGEEMQSYAERVHNSLENGIEAVDQTATLVTLKLDVSVSGAASTSRSKVAV